MHTVDLSHPRARWQWRNWSYKLHLADNEVDLYVAVHRWLAARRHRWHLYTEQISADVKGDSSLSGGFCYTSPSYTRSANISVNRCKIILNTISAILGVQNSCAANINPVFQRNKIQVLATSLRESQCAPNHLHWKFGLQVVPIKYKENPPMASMISASHLRLNFMQLNSTIRRPCRHTSSHSFPWSLSSIISIHKRTPKFCHDRLVYLLTGSSEAPDGSDR